MEGGRVIRFYDCYNNTDMVNFVAKYFDHKSVITSFYLAVGIKVANYD